MHRFNILAIAILLMIFNPAWSSGDDVDVYLLGGQSNMVGSGQIAELPKDLMRPFENVFFWNGKTFEIFHPGKTILAGKGERFGPEIGLIAELTREQPTGRKIYLIKYAVGGMPLDHRFDKQKWSEGEPAPGRINFYPGKAPDDPNQGMLYIKLIRQFRSGIDAIRAEGHTPNIQGFAWMQGEADTRQFAAASQFAKNFRQLVARVREDMGTPKLPVVFGKVLPHVKKIRGKRQNATREIHRQMLALDMGSSRPFATSRTRMVETAAFEMKSDNVHFSTKGQLGLGKAFATGLAQAAATEIRYDIWGENTPGFPADYTHKPPHRLDAEHITEVSKAYLEFFPATKPNPNKASVIVFPGGGYRVLADLKEGNRVAQFVADQGFHAFVLRYRVTRNSSEPFMFPGPLYDARRAIQFVKSNADKFNIDPTKLGVMGFSAGGHLAAMAATCYNDPLPGESNRKMINNSNEKTKAANQNEFRPALAALIYPVASMIAPESHRGSRRALFGAEPSDDQLIAASPERRLTESSPKLFIVHNELDPVSSLPSLRLAIAATETKVPCELHLYPSKTHGFGMGGVKDTETTEPGMAWPRQFVKFMRRQ